MNKYLIKRVAIIGSGGAGKSTLARKMGVLLNLLVHHLDKVFWLPNWEKMSQSEWVIDGNYGSTMDRRSTEQQSA